MRYVGRVGTPDGRILEQSLQAQSLPAARDELVGQGYHVFDLRPVGLGALRRLPQFRWGSLQKSILPEQEFLVFNQELAALLKAGLPLLQCLDLMLNRQGKPAFRTVLQDIRERIKSGEELSAAFASYGDAFPRLYASTLKAGERSGELETVIRRFVRYQKLVIDTRKKVKSALVYPAVLIGLSVVMVGVMTIFVIPRFQEFYRALDLELPVSTRAILSLSLFMQDKGLYLAAGAVLLYLAVRHWQGRGLGRAWIDALRLKIPIAGKISHRFALSEFCRSLSTLLAGGLPLVPSLEVAVGSVGNSSLRTRLEPLVPEVREGSAFYQSLDRTGVFEQLTIDMVQVGEATGALDEMLSSVSDFLDGEVETQTQRLLSLVEPVLLVVMGLTVALLLVAMYWPLVSAISRLGS